MMHKWRVTWFRVPVGVRRFMWQATRRFHRLKVWQRSVCLIVVAVVVATSVLLPVLQIINDQRYELSAAARKVVGTPNQHLARKLTYASSASSWQFNATDIPIGSGSGNSSAQAASIDAEPDLKAQVGGSGEKDSSLYAVNLPTDGKKGVRYYDTNTDLSFELVPEFAVSEGRQIDGRVIYPAASGAKLVYTAKNNGMKEDIVLDKPAGDSLEFSYTLQLPDSLEAKILADGSLGIYSPNPALFGTISADSSQDREKIISARQTAVKDHLLFVLPAPVLVESNGAKSSNHAKFILHGDTLRVQATGLEKLSYPLSIDPSVVVTSSSDFELGDSDNISYDSNQISRAGITGGSISGGWSSTASGSYTARFGAGSAAYKNYLYNVGGYDGTSTITTVNYAPINSNGTVGAWNTTTSLPSGRIYSAAVPYNGRLYVYGGYNSGTSALASVIYADINSDGTLGSWTTASHSMGTAVCRFGWTEYNGYLYAAGGATGTVASNCGNTSTTLSNALQYAPILANGDIGTWTTSANTFTTARKDVGLAAYNNTLYVSAGTTDGATTFRDTQYAKVGSSGDVGSWTTSAQQLSTGIYRFGYRAYNGYLYISGGTNNLTGTRYAPILANGDIGAWTTTATMSGAGRYGQGFAIYKGYIYYYGGNDTTNYLNDTGYAKIDPAGVPTAFATVASNFTTARALACSVAYNGYLYVMGGSTSDSGSNNVTTVHYTALNASTGNVGTWATTTALPEARGSAGCTAYNGYMYIIGGYTGTNTGLSTVRYAPINSDGTLGTWVTTASSLPTAKIKPGVFTYATSSGTYLYSIGGMAQNDGSQTTKSYYSLIGSNGLPGAWSTASTDMAASGRTDQGFAQVGKYIYAIGGHTGSPSTAWSTVEYTSIQSSGDLGIWSTTTSMNTAIGFTNGTTVNGCIYSVGGEDAAAISLANVQYACPSSDGTIAAWYNAPNLSVATTDLGVTSYNGYIYGTGGYTTSVQATTQFAAVNNGGTGGVSTWTTNASEVTSGTTEYAATISGSYIYITGGQVGGTARATGVYARLNSDGSIGAWTALPTMNVARGSHGLYSVGGYLYAVLGYSGSGEIASSEYAKINSDGSIGAWTMATASRSSPPDSFAYASYNGRIYALGGNNGTDTSTVLYADVSSGGDFSSWSTTTAMPIANYGASAVAVNGYMYVVGGGDSGVNKFNQVISAPINSDGTLGSWNYTTPLPLAAHVDATAYNGYMYVVMPADAVSGSQTKTLRAPIYSGGALGSWEPTTSVPAADSGAAKVAVAANGYLYGFRNGINVYYGSINVLDRSSIYSRTVDLSGGYALASITFGGSIPGGLSNISYKAANATGTFGALTSSRSLPGTVTGCTGDVDVRYVQLIASLNDSRTAIFPDSNSSRATITDVTLNYQSPRGDTNQRLIHGKFFNNDTLQGLDTCQV